jgi:hypothetical protein
MVFKLKNENHVSKLRHCGSQLFNPSDKKRPMKEWVQVPTDYKNYWKNTPKRQCNR